ncbi:patatin-like phospholipase family protein, partial [Brachybacterium alimentarium]
MAVPHHSPSRSSNISGGQRVDLVLEGGGVKGIALAGAIEVLEERGYRVNRVAGSSAGSIAGALVTADIPASTLVQILRETDYRMFQDGPFWVRLLPGKVLSVLLHNGIYRTTAL